MSLSTETGQMTESGIQAHFDALFLLHSQPELQARLAHVPWTIDNFSRFSERPEIAWKAAHVVRVTLTALAVAKEMGFSEEEQDLVAAIAITHDTGFVDERIQVATINKRQGLTNDDVIELDQHAIYSADIIINGNNDQDSFKERVARIVAHHHQRQKRKPQLLYPLPELPVEDEKFVALLAACDQVDTIASKGQPQGLWGRPYLEGVSSVSQQVAYEDVLSNFPGQEDMVGFAVVFRYGMQIA